MLKLTDVRSGYGTTPALHGVDLTVTRGDRIAVLGRNGAGKTTLMRTIVGQVPLTSGEISLDDRKLDRQAVHDRARLGIAYVPQGREIFGSLSVRENLLVSAYGTRQKDIGARFDDVLAELPALVPKLNHRGGSLSGGQQQILALGRALVTQPRILLLDEPSEGIQPSIVAEIGEIVLRLNEQRGITVVLVEQNLDFALRVAKHAHIMVKGQIVRDLPAKEVLDDLDLQHEYMGV